MPAATVNVGGLTIINHLNGLPDYDWYRLTAGATGVFTASMNYNSTGDLDLRVYTVDNNNTLILLGSSATTGQSKQSVSVVVPAGAPILIWVYGFNFSQGAYDLTFTLA
jgi:hypothetical protein